VIISNIRLVDSGVSYYRQKADNKTIGRQYDNNADSLIISAPELENGSECVMIIETPTHEVIDHLTIALNQQINIPNNISQHETVLIGFSFMRQDGSIKNTEFLTYQFLPALKPDGFVPVDPAQVATLEYLAENAFVSAEQDGTTGDAIFYNSDNSAVFRMTTGTKYKAGDGISISDDNTISVSYPAAESQYV